jgi:hypothetical protein
MKAIIWIIVLALVAWGIWWFVGNDDVVENADTGANAAGAIDLNLGGDADASVDGDVDLNEFEDKG